MAIEKLKSTPSYHTYKAKSKPKPTTRPNFTNKQTAELSNGMRAYNSILIRRNPILFNKKKISKLKNQVAKDFFNELNANSPQKCALLLNNEDFTRYCDYEYGIFTDKYKSKNVEKVDIFKKSLDNVGEKELKNILAALSKRLKSLYGAYIINAIILYSNNKEAFEYLINSPVDNRKALLPRYSRDLCEQVLGKLPPDVVQTISYNTLKVIEKGIKSNFDFSPYTKDSDRFLNSQEDVEETREYLSNCVCEGDFRAYRGEKSSWIFETIKIDKDMQEEIRLLINSNPNSKRDIIFPNNKRYSDTAKESIYSYITDNKSDLTLADAMLVCKYADKDFIEKVLKKIDGATVQDKKFKSYTLSKNFATAWAHHEGKIQRNNMVTIIADTTIKKGSNVAYDPQTIQHEFIVNDNLKTMTFKNAKFDNKTNTFFVEAQIEPYSDLSL